jgi:hypothetical protein
MNLVTDIVGEFDGCQQFTPEEKGPNAAEQVRLQSPCSLINQILLIIIIILQSSALSSLTSAYH